MKPAVDGRSALDAVGTGSIVAGRSSRTRLPYSSRVRHVPASIERSRAGSLRPGARGEPSTTAFESRDWNGPMRSPSRSQHSTARSRHPLAHSRLGVARRDSMAFERLEAGGSRVESTVVQGDSRRSADQMGSPSACGPNSATVYGPIAVCQPPESELGAPGIGTGRSSRAFARDWSRVIRVRSAGRSSSSSRVRLAGESKRAG